MAHRYFVLAAVCTCFCLPHGRAADFHVTGEGTGQRDGSSWERALSASNLAKILGQLTPGDRVRIGSGTYSNLTLTMGASGSPHRPVIVEGVATSASGLPIFQSNWRIDTASKGATAVILEPGISNVIIRNVRIRGYQLGIVAKPHSNVRSGLFFEDVDIEQMRHGFYLSHCAQVSFTGCDLKRYSKHGFRFEQGNSNVVMRQCSADCSERDPVWETKTEALPMGFLVNDSGAPNTDFLFDDCLARNNMMPLQKSRYKNGDGWVVEGNTRNVIFRRCRSIRNQDAGFDLKVPEVSLADCVAHSNKRDYRIWTTGTLSNCFSGWSRVGLWWNGGPVKATHCTFHDLAEQAIQPDDMAREPVTLVDCLVSSSKQSDRAGRLVRLEGCVSYGSGAVQDPAYVRPEPSWDGRGDAMNSRTYPDKGYRSVR